MPVMYYVSHKEVKLGPFTYQEVKKKLNTNDFDPNDLVFVEGKNQWTKLGEHPDFKTSASLSNSTSLPNIAPESLGFVAPPPPPKAPPPPLSKPLQGTTAKTGDRSDTLQLRDGIGTIELSDLNKSGTFLLLMQSDQFKESEPISLAIEAGEAKELRMHSQPSTVVGESLKIHVQTHDDFGNKNSKFSETIGLLYNGSAKGPNAVTLKNGEAEFEVSNTVAETCEISLNLQKIQLRSTPLKIEFKAGPAVKLLLDSPSKMIAGEKVKLQVRAVDQFGNLSSHFSSAIQLKIEPLDPSEEAA